MAVGLTLISTNRGGSYSSNTTSGGPKSNVTTSSALFTSSSSSSSSASSSSSSSLAVSSSSLSSSFSSTQTSSSHSGTTIGGVTLVGLGNNAYDAVYDSVNDTIFTQTSYPFYGTNSDLIYPSNGTVKSLGGSGGILGYNSTSGIIYLLQTENNIGCGVGVFNQFYPPTNSHNGIFEAGLSGSAVIYDPVYHYFAFAQGSPNNDGSSSGPCSGGIYVYGGSSSSGRTIPTGPQPPGGQGTTSVNWYTTVPSLAFNSLSGMIYVPVLNVTFPDGQSPDATYLYEVNGYTVLPANYTFPGRTERLVFDSSNQLLYAEQLNTSNNSTSILVINPVSGFVEASIPVSQRSPMVYDSSNSLIYVFDKTQILAISGPKVENIYPEPTFAPTAAVYVSQQNELVEFYPSPPATSQISVISIKVNGSGGQYLSASAQIANSTTSFTQGQTIDVQIVLKANGGNAEVYSWSNTPSFVFGYRNSPFLSWDVQEGGMITVNIYFYAPWVSYNGTLYIILLARST
jgi:hypothetical protein